MHRGLIKLMLLQARAVARRSFRGTRSLRGAIYLILGVSLLVLWLGPSVLNAFILPRTDPRLVRVYFPLGLLTSIVTIFASSAGERAVAFSPAEVEFLFAGPFSRRQLLGYKVCKSAFAALFTATFFSLILMRFAQHWVAAWMGFFLALLFIQLVCMTIALIGQTIGERAYTRGRRVAIVIVLGAIVAIVAPLIREAASGDFHEVPFKFAASRGGKILLAPFNVFGQIMAADSVVPDALRWAGIGVVMNLFLLLIVMQLDAQYQEAAARTGEQIYQRIQKMRRGSTAGAFGVIGNSRLRFPMLPRFAGAGPIAWRQMTTALRTSRATLIILLVICASVGPIVVIGGLTHSNQKNGALAAMLGMISWLTFVLSNTLKFDFRGDLDHIDVLKTLPVAPSALAVAQLASPVMVLMAGQMLLIIGFGSLMHMSPLKLAAALFIALPLDVLLVELENLIFLLFPVRMGNISPGDLQGFGRQMVVFLMKMIALLFLLGIAAAVGALVLWSTDKSFAAAYAATFVVLVVESFGMIPLIVLAFAKFDPSVDTPA